MGAIWKGIKRNARQAVRNNQIDLLPMRRWVRGYGKQEAKGDFRAGLNVALLAFPQSMAYAFIAGLPIQYGIYGAIVASILGGIFSRSHFVTLGPTNATAIMVLSTMATMGFAQAAGLVALPLLLVMVGILLIVGACLRVANLIQYISRTVVTGYVTAAAALIIANQIPACLGFTLDRQATTLLAILEVVWEHLPDTLWPTLVMSIVTFAVYLVFEKWLPRLPNVAMTLLVMSVLGWGMRFLPWFDYGTLDAVNISDWKWTLPVVGAEEIARLSSAALAISLLCILEATSIGKAVAARTGGRLDANQEMFSMGIANAGCGFTGGMVASGSLTRSALNAQSGAVTPMSNIFSGLLLAVGAIVFGSLTQYIPRASLAVLVICIGISLVNWHTIRVVFKATKSDAVVFLTTFLSGLMMPLDTAVYYGVGISIILFLRKAAAPELIEYTFNEEGELTELADGKRVNPEISIVHVEGNLFFGAADLFRDQIRRVFEDPNLRVVVLKMRNAHLLDATSVLALEELVKFMRDKDRVLLVSEARKDVIRIFKRSGLLEVLGRENIFPDVVSNHTLSTANALRRAKALLGGEQPKISIYASEKNTGNGNAPTQ